MNYVKGILDLGIVISPDKLGEPFYEADGGGIREAVLNYVNGTYYLFYDGATPGAKPDSYWNACLAESKDCISWKKRGLVLKSSAITHPESSNLVYMDFKSASSPWVYQNDGKWYMYYVGAGNCSPEGIPALPYSTLLAQAGKIDGPWYKRNDINGCEKHVCFPLGKDSWDDSTASPGQVIKNPNYNPNTTEKEFLMFYSGCCSGLTKRSIGIARTNNLGCSDDYDKEQGEFWERDKNPILSPDEDIENSSVFYEEESGYYYLFTNHIYNNSHTDSIWVYRTKNIEKWCQEDKAIVVDSNVSTWAKGAIGMPNVLKKDAKTLILIYDGVVGNGIGHLNRCIGLAEIELPLKF